MRTKKIAICAVQIPFMHGGAEKLTDGLYVELLKRGLNVEMINVPFKWYPADRLITECMIWRLMDISESDGKKIDVVIATKFPSTVVRHPDKRIWLIHQHRPVYDLYGTGFGIEFRTEVADTGEIKAIREMIINIDNVTIREAKRIYTISKNVTERLKRYNGIESLSLYPPPENRKLFYSDSYGNYVLYVGRLDAIKRVSLLIEAFKFVKPNVRCLIVGTGNDKDNLLQSIKNFDLYGRVELLGYLPDAEVIRLYAGALAVFYAPHDEDYGYATVEAFLSRRPVITTIDSGGVLEFVRDGENGFVVNTNPEEIAEKIDWLYENKQKGNDFGSNGYEVVKDITWDSVIERLID